MKKLTSFLAIALPCAIIFTSSCKVGCINGSGNATTENRKSGNFKKLDIEGSFKVVLKQDSSDQLVVTADDNLQKYIRTNINGDRLRIYSRKNLCNKTPMTLTIGVRNLELLQTAGAVEVSNSKPLNVKNLRLELNGASKADMMINATNLQTDGSGATEIKLKGLAATHKVDITGSGKLMAFDFIAGDYNVETTGAAELEINVLRSLKTNTTGAANIKYKGNPTVIQKDKAGAASVKKVD